MPVRLVLVSLAAAGLCAVIGLYVPRFNGLAIVLYGTVAIGLILYGLFGSLAATFKEGLWHGIACLLFPAIYPIYFYATHPVGGWRPFVNMVLGFGLTWVAIQTFPMFRHADAKPARPLLVGGDPLEKIGPSPERPGPARGRGRSRRRPRLAKLLATVTDETSARKAAPRSSSSWPSAQRFRGGGRADGVGRPRHGQEHHRSDQARAAIPGCEP